MPQSAAYSIRIKNSHWLPVLDLQHKSGGLTLHELLSGVLRDFPNQCANSFTKLFRPTKASVSWNSYASIMLPLLHPIGLAWRRKRIQSTIPVRQQRIIWWPDWNKVSLRNTRYKRRSHCERLTMPCLSELEILAGDRLCIIHRSSSELGNVESAIHCNFRSQYNFLAQCDACMSYSCPMQTKGQNFAKIIAVHKMKQ